MKERKLQTRLVLATMWRMLAGFRLRFMAIWVLIAIASCFGLALPWLYKAFFDTIAGDIGVVGSQALIRIVLWMLALHGGAWAVWRVTGFGSALVLPKAIERMYQDGFSRLMRHSYRFFSNQFSGSLVRRLNRFVDSFERMIDRLQWNVIPLIVTIVGVTSALFVRNVWLGVAMVGWIAVVLVLNIVFSLWKLKFDLHRATTDSEVTARISDTIANITNVKLFAAYTHEERRLSEAVDAYRKAWTKSWNASEFIMSVQVLLMIGVEIGLLLLGVRLWEQGVLTVGDFALLQGYLISVFDKVWDFGRTIRDLYEQIANASEMAEMLATPYEVTDRRGAKPLVVQKGKIEFDDVSFNYHKTRRILEDFNLTVKPGEKVAFVGPSGAGKTTVTKLLLRMFDVSRGEIRIDGQDVSRVTMESVWEHVSLVPQEPVLFHRSIMENIRYGKRDATDAEVIEAAKQARCHEFISGLPQGYDTFVGERGVKLSGGERQRVAIARAILKNAPVLILDEATSSLDSESEALIQEALEELMKGKTTIVIAHRLSTIMKMDRIVVIEHGRVADVGTHKGLLRKAGTYKKLWSIQAGGFV